MSDQYFVQEKRNFGKYLFVSDIHGYNQNLAIELEEIAQDNPPRIVFFTGDLVGTDLLDNLQKLFYEVFNKMKTLKNASNQEIHRAVCKETSELYDYLNKISNNFNGVELIQFAKTISTYTHFGHFVGNLPSEIKDKLKKDIEINAQKMLDIMVKFTCAGSEVVIVEGNWDARTPLDFYPSIRCIPIPIKDRLFYLKDFIKFRNQKIIFIDSPTLIETENINFQLLSFDNCMNYEPGTFKSDSNKPVILISHVQADWQAVKKQAAMTFESKQISEKIKTIISDLQPSAIVHGHLHSKLIDQQGQECDGYLYPENNNIKVHYLPLHAYRFINF